ncbi:MAG TPA: hypothetical protein V6C58_10285 [Allocoleopsis sp.]
MASPSKINFKVYQGSTFNEVLRWESSTKVYKAISGISQSAPVVIQVPGHGIPVGWRAKVTNVSGMKEINMSDYEVVSAVTNDSITFNNINALGYTAYTSGGVVEYNQPNSLAGMTARMQIREKQSSTSVIKELTTENGGISINDTNKTITILISATDTAAFTFKTAVYSMELINGATVTPFIFGDLTLVTEITR